MANIVMSGETASGVPVGAGQVLTVASGGTLISATVSGGGDIIVSGGVALATSVGSGGTLDVLTGSASGTVIGSSGKENVSGIDSGALVTAGGTQSLTGGQVFDAVISGGLQTLVNGYAGQDVFGDTVEAGGVVSANAGATFSGTVVRSGGALLLAGQDSVQATQISGGGSVTMFAGTASGSVVSSGGVQILVTQGRASATTILSGGTEVASSGGLVKNSVVEIGGREVFISGAVLSGITVEQGGLLGISGEVVAALHNYVLSGIAGGSVVAVVSGDGSAQTFNLAMGAVVSSGATITVYSGAVASNTVVRIGGTEILSGGTAYGTAVSGGREVVLSGGVASGTTTPTAFNSFITVSAGGQLIGAQVQNITIVDLVGGFESGSYLDGVATMETLDVASGTATSEAVGTVLQDATQIVLQGSALGATLFGHATQLLSGGLASGTTVNSGSTQSARSSSVVSNTVVSSGGLLRVGGGLGVSALVLGGGLASAGAGLFSATTVQNGGTISLRAQGSSRDTVLNAGAFEIVSSGGVASRTMASGGATESIFSGATASGAIVYGGGVQVVSGGRAVGTVLSGGELDLVSGGAISGGVTFAGAGAMLVEEDAGAPGGVLYGVLPGDTIVLRQVAYDAGGTASVLSGGVLHVVENGASYDITLDPAQDFTGRSFHLGNATSGGTAITETGACYLTGTRIATLRGEIEVQDLRAGDLLCRPDGPPVPLRWLGRSRTAARFGDPVRVLPVRIRAGALGEGLPRRDLLVSPGHALFVDGVLIHAGALVNGTRIVREHGVAELFDYWHIECDTHVLLLAEGAAAESFLDGVEDFRFDNWADRIAPPDTRELPHPRCKSPRQVPRAVRARLGLAAAA